MLDGTITASDLGPDGFGKFAFAQGQFTQAHVYFRVAGRFANGFLKLGSGVGEAAGAKEQEAQVNVGLNQLGISVDGSLVELFSFGEPGEGVIQLRRRRSGSYPFGHFFFSGLSVLILMVSWPPCSLPT